MTCMFYSKSREEYINIFIDTFDREYNTEEILKNEVITNFILQWMDLYCRIAFYKECYLKYSGDDTEKVRTKFKNKIDYYRKLFEIQRDCFCEMCDCCYGIDTSGIESKEEHGVIISSISLG